MRMRGARRDARRDAAERLYALNQGALRQQGIRLPVELGLEVSASYPSGTARAVRNALKAMGLEIVEPAHAEDATGARFRLRVQAQGGSARCELYDRGRGTVLFSAAIPLASHSRKNISAFSMELGDLLFIGGRD